MELTPEQTLQAAFEAMGGVERLRDWADRHPEALYKLYRQLPLKPCRPARPALLGALKTARTGGR